MPEYIVTVDDAILVIQRVAEHSSRGLRACDPRKPRREGASRFNTAPNSARYAACKVGILPPTGRGPQHAAAPDIAARRHERKINYVL
jgi:hypothetical protein